MTEPNREALNDFVRALIGAVIICAFLTLIISCSGLSTIRPSTDDSRMAPSAEAVSFEKTIKPILEQRCVVCHHGQVAAGDLDLRTRALAFRRSSNGPFFVPGYPERSKLFRMIRLENDEPGAMPPTGHGLTEHEIALFRGWIAQGAAWPEDERGHLRP